MAAGVRLPTDTMQGFRDRLLIPLAGSNMVVRLTSPFEVRILDLPPEKIKLRTKDRLCSR